MTRFTLLVELSRMAQGIYQPEQVRQRKIRTALRRASQSLMSHARQMNQFRRLNPLGRLRPSRPHRARFCR